MKRLLCALLAGLSLLTLSGCRSAFEREYYYETPFSGDIGTPSDDAAEIRNYNMLKTALTNMIAGHAERGELLSDLLYGQGMPVIRLFREDLSQIQHLQFLVRTFPYLSGLFRPDLFCQNTDTSNPVAVPSIAQNSRISDF